MKRLLDRIRDRRIELGISQEEMAQKVGVNQSSYGKLERGITQMGLNKLESILETLGIDFFEESQDPEDTLNTKVSRLTDMQTSILLEIAALRIELKEIKQILAQKGDTPKSEFDQYLEEGQANGLEYGEILKNFMSEKLR